MGSTKIRSFVKAACWETLALIITFLVFYIIYRDLIDSINFSVILTIIKIFFLYFHERFWKKIKWGKIK